MTNPIINPFRKKWVSLMKKWAFEETRYTKIRFLGSNAHFFKSDTHFFVSEWICYVIYLFRWKNIRTLCVIKWAFDPKNQIFMFLGSYAHFFMSDTHFLFLSGFVIAIVISPEKINGCCR